MTNPIIFETTSISVQFEINVVLNIDSLPQMTDFDIANLYYKILHKRGIISGMYEQIFLCIYKIIFQILKYF